MILQKLEQNWDKIERIGAEAEERGRIIGVQPSWINTSDYPTDDNKAANAIADAVWGTMSAFGKR